MQPEPIIQNLPEKIIAGKKLNMSLQVNRTGELWKSFMEQRHLLTERTENEFFSVQIYPKGYFEKFDPLNEFEKWAGAEVANPDAIAAEMQKLIIPAGTYAVFHYKGSSLDTTIFRYIFTEWLPRSEYELDDRPHFEILGEKYKNADPHSEEDICIPVKPGKRSN
jgi:AraC family transcriptional regulator